jgi:hypothetical protein
MVQSWLDNAGLYQKYGVDQTTVGKGGEYRNNENERVIEFKINLATLTETETILDDNVFMPAGMRISEVKIKTHTAAATGTAIDLGLVRTDRTTEIDFNGILAAFPTASMTPAGETFIYTQPNTAEAGALVGTTTANVGQFTCSRTDSTAFTAGIIYVTIKYYRP